VVSSSSRTVDALLANMKNDLALKDLGNLHYFLGIEVKHTSDGLLLTQEKYSSDLLRRIGMMACLQRSYNTTFHQHQAVDARWQILQCGRGCSISYSYKTRFIICYQ
jgi:hypothetical protein